jgi:hypothetical protein
MHLRVRYCGSSIAPRWISRGGMVEAALMVGASIIVVWSVFRLTTPRILMRWRSLNCSFASPLLTGAQQSAGRAAASGPSKFNSFL